MKLINIQGQFLRFLDSIHQDIVFQNMVWKLR